MTDNELPTETNQKIIIKTSILAVLCKTDELNQICFNSFFIVSHQDLLLLDAQRPASEDKSCNMTRRKSDFWSSNCLNLLFYIHHRCWPFSPPLIGRWGYNTTRVLRLMTSGTWLQYSVLSVHVEYKYQLKKTFNEPDSTIWKHSCYCKSNTDINRYDEPKLYLETMY